MTSRILQMAAEVEKLQGLMPAKDARDFLRVACNLPSSELATYVGFAEKLKGSEELVEGVRASFPVVKALVAADDDARNEVLERMRLGARIDAQGISAIRKRLRAAKLSPLQVLAESNLRAVKAAARKGSIAKSDALQKRLRPLVMKLFETKAADLPALAASNDFRREASSLRDECLAVFGKNIAEATTGKSGAQVVSLGYQALCLVADGRFGADAVADNGDDTFANHYALVTALRRLAGIPTPMGGWDGRGKVLSEQPPHRVKLKALELCAGAGGMSLGLERAGFAHAALFEFDKHAAATLRRNRPDWNVISDDIRKVDFRPFRQQQIALVAGGLPCQPYSQEGNQLGKNDPRDLLLEAVRVAREVKPRAFMFENVAGLLHERHADHLAAALRGFGRAGYATEIHRVNVSDFGIAQSRTRILIVGIQKEYAGALRMPSGFPHRRANLGDALVDLMAENNWTGARDWATRLRNHPVLDRNGNLVAHGAQASTLVTSQGNRRKNADATWDGLGFDMSKLSEHAPTEEEASTAGFKPGLTLRMKARLQDFPDDWVFSGGKASATKQIGNAVPPRLAQAVGLALFGAIRNLKIDWEPMLWPHASVTRRAIEAPLLTWIWRNRKPISPVFCTIAELRLPGARDREQAQRFLVGDSTGEPFCSTAERRRDCGSEVAVERSREKVIPIFSLFERGVKSRIRPVY